MGNQRRNKGVLCQHGAEINKAENYVEHRKKQVVIADNELQIFDIKERQGR
jgi:hypothetical protein